MTRETLFPVTTLLYASSPLPSQQRESEGLPCDAPKPQTAPSHKTTHAVSSTAGTRLTKSAFLRWSTK